MIPLSGKCKSCGGKTAAQFVGRAVGLLYLLVEMGKLQHSRCGTATHSGGCTNTPELALRPRCGICTASAIWPTFSLTGELAFGIGIGRPALKQPTIEGLPPLLDADVVLTSVSSLELTASGQRPKIRVKLRETLVFLNRGSDVSKIGTITQRH